MKELSKKFLDEKLAYIHAQVDGYNRAHDRKLELIEEHTDPTRDELVVFCNYRLGSREFAFVGCRTEPFQAFERFGPTTCSKPEHLEAFLETLRPEPTKNNSPFAEHAELKDILFDSLGDFVSPSRWIFQNAPGKKIYLLCNDASVCQADRKHAREEAEKALAGTKFENRVIVCFPD